MCRWFHSKTCQPKQTSVNFVTLAVSLYDSKKLGNSTTKFSNSYFITNNVNGSKKCHSTLWGSRDVFLVCQGLYISHAEVSHPYMTDLCWKQICSSILQMHSVQISKGQVIFSDKKKKKTLGLDRQTGSIWHTPPDSLRLRAVIFRPIFGVQPKRQRSNTAGWWQCSLATL